MSIRGRERSERKKMDRLLSDAIAYSQLLDILPEAVDVINNLIDEYMFALESVEYVGTLIYKITRVEQKEIAPFMAAAARHSWRLKKDREEVLAKG